MVKIVEGFPKNVVFLYGFNEKTKKLQGSKGTGFFVSRRSANDGRLAHDYIITNKHVARLGISRIRVNTLDGKSRNIEIKQEEWEYLGNNDDLAAVDVTEKISSETDDVISLEEDFFITRDVINNFEISIGEDVLICGMFSNHHGNTRNIPVGRFGNISMIADDTAPIKIASGESFPAHLIDMRSKAGFSGSPVFAYRTVTSDLSHLPYGFERAGRAVPQLPTYDEARVFIGLLGVHCGQFPEWTDIEVKKSNLIIKEAHGDVIKEGDRLKLQSSMAIIIPAWRVTALLNLEVFELKRRERDEARDDQSASIADLESSEELADATAEDENPRHREDFTALLNAAAKTKPQAD